MSHNYHFTEEEPEKRDEPWPLRVTKIFDSYKAASQELAKSTRRKIEIAYIPQQIDYIEKIFDFRVSKRPDTLRLTINSIYRCRRKKEGRRDEDKEYYLYSATKICNTANNNMAKFTYDKYGYHRAPVLALDHNTENKVPQPKVVAYEHAFYLPWDKEQVRKLLEESEFPCINFYVGYIGQGEPLEDRIYSIQNQEDFLEGSFQDLYDLSRLGVSYPEPSLHLIDAARKQERENREKQLGMGNNAKPYG